jgi:hypothetical protein
LKECAGHQLYASKMSVQNEFIPLLYDMIISQLSLSDGLSKEEGVMGATQILMDLNFSMD